MGKQKNKAVNSEEDIKEYMEQEYEDSGYKDHSFSLLDNPLEIATVLFITVYLVYIIWKFTNLVSSGITVADGFDYWLTALARFIPAVVLLVATEIYEKMQMLEYNIKLNSYYMAQYQMNLVSMLDGNPEAYEEETEEDSTDSDGTQKINQNE